MIPTITTERLVLRPPKPKDERQLIWIMVDDEVTRYLQWPPYRDLTEVSTYLLKGLKMAKAGLGHLWIIEREKEVLGTFSVRYEQRHAAVFGGFLGRQCWRQGYGIEIGTSVLAWLQQDPGIYRVSCQADVRNEAIAALVPKLGLTYEGRLGRAWPGHDTEEPRDVYQWAWTR